jgi:hypothetical protein
MTSYKIKLFVYIFFLLCMAASSQTQAHNRSLSYSSWSLSDTSVDMVFTVKSREVTRLPPLEGNLPTLEGLLLKHLSSTISVLASDQTTCLMLNGPIALAAAEGYLRVGVTFSCDKATPASIVLTSFFAVAPSHVHHARIGIGDSLPQEYLFTNDKNKQYITAVNLRNESSYRAFLQYLVLGIEHILGGIDHLAFLAAILLLVKTMRGLVLIVTGFTIGHSITLALAVLGHVSIELWVVEALIGFTVAVVAAENIGALAQRRMTIASVIVVTLLIMAGVSIIWGVGLPPITLLGLIIFTMAFMSLSNGDKADSIVIKPALTLAFGMVHGFGFANVLREIGLPDERLFIALAGFNIGVELGQLAVVAIFWLVLWLLANKIKGLDYHRHLNTVSAVLCGLGVYWFVSRGFMPV